MGALTPQRAARQINSLFLKWETVREGDDYTQRARQFVDFLKSTTKVLRDAKSTPPSDKFADLDLRVDTSLRIALIAMRMYQKYYDEIGAFMLSGGGYRFHAGARYLHSTIQHALNGFVTGMRPVHSIERLGASFRIEKLLVLGNGIVTIRQLLTTANSPRWIHGIGEKRLEELSWAFDLYRDKRPNPLVSLPVLSETDLPDEIPEVDDFAPAYLQERERNDSAQEDENDETET